MKQRWIAWNDAFAVRSAREKWLIAVCGLVAVALLLQTWLLDPVLARYQQQSSQLASLNAANGSKVMTIQQFEVALSKNPDADVDKQLANLQAQSQELSMTLAELTSTLVSPTQMAQLLQSVLERSSKLKLISLTSLPAEPMKTGQAQQEQDSTTYYVHPVRLELTGSYFAIRDYLLALESLPVKYYWRSFHYAVEEYPQARLIVQVYTLGSRQEFIGG